ncbi:hypothetical protein AYK24_09810 [Thermoplasmatales archaeon SG8-52-4]|nr:MAG: hypothetical protein AYK24_09810 [Thermoplasmatales archaeon SG8-52-4]
MIRIYIVYIICVDGFSLNKIKQVKYLQQVKQVKKNLKCSKKMKNTKKFLAMLTTFNKITERFLNNIEYYLI